MSRPSALVVSIGEPHGGLAKVAERTAAGMALEGEVQLSTADFGSPRVSEIVRDVWRLRRSAKGHRIVVLQASPHHWSRGPALCGLLQAVLVDLALFRKAVLVMHDTPDGGWRRSTAYPRAIGLLHWALGRRLVFLSNSERAQAGLAGRGRHVRVVPHYIEPRNATSSRRPMNTSDLRLGVVGFIDRRKDPLFALEVLKRIDGATLTFLGGPLADDEAFAARLQGEVIRHGLDERVRITGYLTEEDMDAELGRLDIGLCLYRHAATSGSLSTLLAARCPVVASDLPIFREYAAASPRAVTIVDMFPESAARAIAALAVSEPDWTGEFDDVIRARSVPNFGRAMWHAAGVTVTQS